MTEKTILYMEKIGDFAPTYKHISYESFLKDFGEVAPMEGEERSQWKRTPWGQHHTRQVNKHRSGLVAVREFEFPTK